MEDIRSLLFVPGDSERKIAKAQGSVADALILDLEDAVLPDNRPAARQVCREALLAAPSRKQFVRINGLDTEDALLDLAAVVGGRPYGVMVPKCGSADDLRVLDRYLFALEVREGLPRGGIQVLPIVTETGASLFGARSYGAGVPRLAGMLWGGEDLAADIGARRNRGPDGTYTPLFQMARNLCLLAATASGCTAVDAVYTDFRNPDGLREEAAAAARDGFTAKAAIHPDQAAVINEVFTPTAEEVEHAGKVVNLFETAGTGVVTIDGRMLDKPHLVMARRLLKRAR